MTDFRNLSESLCKSLNLGLTPIAMAFSDEKPEGIADFDATVAAGCQFWELAATRTFATSAHDHRLCSIGIHTHNLTDAPETQSTELTTTLQAMMGLDYVRAEEIASIPVKELPSRYVVYGPLHSFPMQPELVMVFADAAQGLLLSEAVSRVDSTIPLAMGRPACAVVPFVTNNNVAAQSLGCCGARAYLDVLTDSTSQWALPGSKLALYCEQIDRLSSANQLLSRFHQRRRNDVLAGETPSVQESLLRLA